MRHYGWLWLFKRVGWCLVTAAAKTAIIINTSIEVPVGVCVRKIQNSPVSYHFFRRLDLIYVEVKSMLYGTIVL